MNHTPKAALKTHALQTLRAGEGRQKLASAFGVRASLAPLFLRSSLKMRFNGLMREWFREILSMNPQSNLCKSLSHLGQRIVPAQFMVPMNDSQIVEAFHEPPSCQPTPDPSQEGNSPPGVAPLLGGAGGGFRGRRREKVSGNSLPIGWGVGRGEGRRGNCELR